MRNKDVRRPLLIAFATLAFIGGGTSLVLACGSGWGGGGAAYHQYKPGCGPDKTDGVAGNSGQHIGQPPKDQHRGDCPNPPGQCDKGSSSYKNVSYSTKSDDDCHEGGDKPGCGPDKTDGVAGNSGRHQGQPPKDQDRGDCPNPPGQQNGGDKKEDDQKKGSSGDDKKGSSNDDKNKGSSNSSSNSNSSNGNKKK